MYEHFLFYDTSIAILAGARNNLPNFPLGIEDEDGATGKRISVPASPSFSIPTPRLGRPSDIDR